MATRDEVYDALDSERDYQDQQWNAHTTSTAGQHSVTEFLVFIQDYLTQAMHQVSRESEPFASEKALHTVRKITAMGVACMEQHGAPKR